VRLLGLGLAVRRLWRRSLQLRVVTTTILLGLVVVLVVGDFLLVRIRDGLIETREGRTKAEAARLIRDTQSDLDRMPTTVSDESAVNQKIRDEWRTWEGPPQDNLDVGVSTGLSRYFVLRHALRSPTSPIVPDKASQVLDAEAVVPQDLRQEVNNDPSRVHGRHVAMASPAGGAASPAFVVGALINIPLAGDYELYFVYSLQDEQRILDLVRTSFVVGGFFLVLLVGGVAFVVTRQVVAPVRQAARTAEELASGRLDRRMLVQGEDDLARLGRAFNEMAEGLERQIHQLEELSRVQRRFVADVSHELRTPLTTVRMASELIFEARGGFEPTLGRSAELLNNQLDRFEALLGDLLEISRFDAGAAALDVESVDVRGVVNRVTDILGPLAERKGSVFRLNVPAEPAVAEIDPRRVERIIRNLVANALEHGEGRPVDVTVGIDADAVAVSVRDHGVGLRESEAAMVFNRFWRADPARARTTGGTGLGLSIALEDAHLHGGRLEVWGRPGFGATFLLTLPCRAGVVLGRSPLSLVPPDDGIETRALRIVRAADEPPDGDGPPDPSRLRQPAGDAP
jgi:two-component system sensor histidine kinase MtrB